MEASRHRRRLPPLLHRQQFELTNKNCGLVVSPALDLQDKTFFAKGENPKIQTGPTFKGPSSRQVLQTIRVGVAVRGPSVIILLFDKFLHRIWAAKTVRRTSVVIFLLGKTAVLPCSLLLFGYIRYRLSSLPVVAVTASPTGHEAHLHGASSAGFNGPVTEVYFLDCWNLSLHMGVRNCTSITSKAKGKFHLFLLLTFELRPLLLLLLDDAEDREVQKSFSLHRREQRRRD